VLGHGISVTANSAFRLLPPMEHVPRVSIDELVVCREAWRFPAAGVGFAFHKREADRFLEARCFATEHGLPRFAFFRTPLEPKPLYVDFESPLYVDILAKAVPCAETVLLVDENGAHAGLSCAEFAAADGAQVEIVTPDPALGGELGGTNLGAHMNELYKHDVRIRTDTRLTAVRRSGNIVPED